MRGGFPPAPAYTPYASRFIDSLLFNLSRLDEETGGKHEFIASCGTAIKPFTYR